MTRSADPALATYAGPAFCHVPADERLELEKLAESDGDDDRWNRPGEPTLYLALDPGVALAELARHLVEGRRRILRFEIELDGVADLRCEGSDGPGVRSAIEIADREAARRRAAVLRANERCRGLVVPSLAFPDDASRANLVVFADRLPRSIAGWLGRPTVVGQVVLRTSD